MDALQKGSIDRLINLARDGYQCEIRENDDAARCLEWNIYREACDNLGPEWWARHEKNCIESKADALDCWEMLLDTLEAIE